MTNSKKKKINKRMIIGGCSIPSQPTYGIIAIAAVLIFWRGFMNNRDGCESEKGGTDEGIHRVYRKAFG